MKLATPWQSTRGYKTNRKFCDLMNWVIGSIRPLCQLEDKGDTFDLTRKLKEDESLVMRNFSDPDICENTIF